MKKIVLIALCTAAIGFSAAPPAHAWSDFIIHLASNACSGQNNYFKNGCYAYIEPRIKAKSTAEALKWCKETRCNDWFSGYSDTVKQKCYDGCTYLYNFGN